MIRPLAILVRGHSPGTGATHGKWSEYATLPEYMIAAELRLRAEGVDVIRLELGTLADRQSRGVAAIEAHRQVYPGAPCIYVSCHLNAGGVDYQRSVLFPDHRSSLGRKAAQVIAREMTNRVGWPSVIRPARPGTPNDSPERAYACIGSIYADTPINCCALLVEPASLDREPLGYGILRRLGADLGAGIAAHLQSEPTS